MKKKENLEKRLQANQKEIETLQTFRSTKYVKQLLRQLFGEQSFIRNEIRRLQSSQETKLQTKQQKRKIANQNRSEKMKRSWRYFKTIQKNYPVKISLRNTFCI
jgi:hypothetical protein